MCGKGSSNILQVYNVVVAVSFIPDTVTNGADMIYYSEV